MLKEKIKDYFKMRKDAIKVAQISDIGIILVPKIERMLKAKVFKPSLIEEKETIENIIKVKSSLPQFIEYFHNKYNVEFKENDLDEIRNRNIGDLFDCKEFLKVIFSVCNTVNRQTKLSVFRLGIVYFTPIEFFVFSGITIVVWYGTIMIQKAVQ